MVDRKILEEIKRMILSYDKVKNNYEKGYIWYVLEYFKELLPYDEEIDELFNKIGLKVSMAYCEFGLDEQLRKNKKQEFVKNNIKTIDEQMPMTEKEYEDENWFLDVLDYVTLDRILGSFLKSTSKDLDAFYRKMIKENRVIQSYDNNTAITSLKNSKSIIFINNLDTLRDLEILVHEIGHAYYIYLNKERVIERNNVNVEIKEEIAPKIMEIMFIKFLEEHGYKESLILKNEFDLTMQECFNKRNDFDKLKYYVASYIASNIDNKENIERLFKDIYKNDFLSIIDRVNERKESKVFKKSLY